MREWINLVESDEPVEIKDHIYEFLQNETYTALIKSYTVNSDGSVNIIGGFSIRHGQSKTVTETGNLPFKIKSITSGFEIFNNGLRTLQNCPDIAGAHYDVTDNEILSLEGCPEIINGSFYCYNNLLTSLKGGPKIVNGTYDCSHNSLISLEGIPKQIKGDFDCSENENLSPWGMRFLLMCDFTGNEFEANNGKVTNLFKQYYSYTPEKRKKLIPDFLKKLKEMS